MEEAPAAAVEEGLPRRHKRRCDVPDALYKYAPPGPGEFVRE